MNQTESNQRIKELERANRVLTKKLQTSERDRAVLEDVNERRWALINTTVLDLEKSKKALEERTQELEATLHTLHQMQSKLIETEKLSALGVLVAGVAHEINNPVSFVVGNIQPAQDYVQDLLGLVELYQAEYSNPPAIIKDEIEAIDLDFLADDLPKLLNSMEMGAGRISQIVKSLRTFTRTDEEGFKMTSLQTGLDSTLMILQHRFKANAEQSEITINQNYANLPPIDCHLGKLNQVFMNLINNAVDAIRECELNAQKNRVCKPGEIRIQATELDPDTIEIRISDNASGIPEPIRDKLFDPFFTTKPVGKGTGLGLSISYQIIIEQHHGQLYCESELGQGTTFVMKLPVQQPLT